MTAGPDPSQTTIELFGVRVGLQAEREELVAAVVSRLPVGARSPIARHPVRQYVIEDVRGAVDGFVIRQGRRKPVRALSLASAADMIVRDLQPLVAHRAEGLVFVHAGVVAWQGRALVLPGRSRSGKTEMVAALIRAGAEYLSDEFAVFDADGRVHPYARALALRQPDGTRTWISPDALGGRVVAEPVRPALIAFLRFSAGAVFRPRPLSPGQIVLRLLRHTVAARKRLPLARSVLVPIAASVPALAAARGDAGEVVEPLLRRLASAPSA